MSLICAHSFIFACSTTGLGLVLTAWSAMTQGNTSSGSTGGRWSTRTSFESRGMGGGGGMTSLGTVPPLGTVRSQTRVGGDCTGGSKGVEPKVDPSTLVTQKDLVLVVQEHVSGDLTLLCL